MLHDSRFEPAKIIIDSVVAVALTAFATVLTLGLRSVSELGLFLFYLGVVTLAAWTRGRYAAFGTVVLSTFALTYTFVQPIGSVFTTTRGDTIGVASFVITGFLVAAITSELRSARTRADRRTALFRKQADELARARQDAESDISERRRNEAREIFLLHASKILGSSLDYASTVQNVAELAVPRLADWCGVQIIDDDGQIRSLAVAHVDPSKVEFARQFQKDYPARSDDPTGVANVIRTGTSEYLFEVTDDLLVAAAFSEKHLEDIRALNIRAAITAPLTVGGRTLGALSLVMAESGRKLTLADVSLAEELGRRAAAAIDNARRFTAEQNARKAAEQNADRIMRLQRVTAALAVAPTARAIADAVISQGLSAFDADEAVLSLLTSDKKSLEIVRSIGLRAGLEEEYHFFPVDAPMPISEAVRLREPLFMANREEVLARYPHLRNSTREPEAAAWAAMPLIVEDAAIGGIALGFKSPREFSPEDREFAMALARQSAQALERARLHDTERSLRTEAEEARNRAEEANLAKSQFLATMSHELRTPLNAIAGYVQLLEIGIHGPVSKEQVEVLNRVRRSQRTLLNIIDDILSFARLESGRVQYRYEYVPALELLQAAHEIIAPQLRAKNLSYTQSCDDKALKVWTDREKFSQIMLNLLSNAVKFTPEGGKVTTRCDGGSETAVVVTVADTGKGIPRDKQEAVFEPFVQAESGLTRTNEGTGLGLAISRDLARAMRGDLTVSSEEGKGSTFTLWLPRKKAEAKEPEA